MARDLCCAALAGFGIVLVGTALAVMPGDCFAQSPTCAGDVVCRSGCTVTITGGCVDSSPNDSGPCTKGATPVPINCQACRCDRDQSSPVPACICKT